LQSKESEDPVLVRAIAELSDRELELATLKAELLAFEARYMRIMARRFARLDGLRAKIAARLADATPGSAQRAARAADAAAQARESDAAAEASAGAPATERFDPSPEFKRLFREVARTVHPDLATDEEDRARRTKLMAEANFAYSAGDEGALARILREAVAGRSGADVAVGPSLEDIRARTLAIESELQELRASELFRLYDRCREAEDAGLDLLAHIADRVDWDIRSAEEELAELMEHQWR
jgi:hypothetical protein